MSPSRCPGCLVPPDRVCIGEAARFLCDRPGYPEAFRDSTVTIEAGSPAPSQPPGLMTRAATFARAVVTHAVAGFPTVDEATAQGRLAICRACPEFNTSDPDKPTCNKCACRMDIKVYWSEQVCPIGKWGKVPPTSPP